MLRTLVLFRTRCGVLDTEVEEDVGGEDKVWTFQADTFKQGHGWFFFQKWNHPSPDVSSAGTFLMIFLP